MLQITQKEMIAYMIFSSDKIIDYTDKTIENYTNVLIKNIDKVPIGQVLFHIDLRLFNLFEFNASLNKEEVLNYAILIYRRLLNYFNRKFTNEDIIKESKFIFQNYSVRTAKDEVISSKMK